MKSKQDNLTVLRYIEGWRYWRIAQSGCSLRSLSNSYLWPAREKAEAVCNKLGIDAVIMVSKYLFSVPAIILAVAAQVFLANYYFLPNNFWEYIIGHVGIIILWTFIAFALIFYKILIIYCFLRRNENFKGCLCGKTPEENIPSFSGMCGIYAYKSKELAVSDCQLRGVVFGRVALWGKIIEHEAGYRAQYAYPLSVEFGVCYHCGQFFPIDSCILTLYNEGICKILCYSCCSRIYSQVEISRAFWKEVIVGNYGIQVGSSKQVLNKFSTGIVDKVY